MRAWWPHSTILTGHQSQLHDARYIHRAKMAQSWPRRRRRHSVADVELKPSRKHAAASRLQSSYADGRMQDGSRLPSERALVCSSGVIQTTARKQLAGCRRQGRNLRLQRRSRTPQTSGHTRRQATGQLAFTWHGWRARDTSRSKRSKAKPPFSLCSDFAWAISHRAFWSMGRTSHPTRWP